MVRLLFIILFIPVISFSQTWFPMNVGVSNPMDNCWVLDINSFQGKLMITGHFKYSGTTILNSVAQWDGIQWQPMSLGLYETGYNCGYGSKFAIYNSHLYLDGIFGAAGGFAHDITHNSANITKWDGTDWHKLTTDTMCGVDFICASLYSYKDNLYIGGDFSIAFSTGDTTLLSGNIINARGIAKWNDTAFSSPFSLYSDYGIHDFYLSSFTTYHNQLVLGGFFTTIDTMPYGTYKFIAGWNDTSYIAYGTGFNKPVFALTQYNGELYAAGMFTASGDNSTALNHVAKWNGTQWQQVGEGLNDTVWTIYVDSLTNKLYAGGAFTQTGLGIQAKHLAEWTGTNWQEVGGGTNSDVFCLYSKDSNLYIGGLFTQVGTGISANHIACWGHNPVGINEINKDETEVSMYPNPATNEIRISSTGHGIKKMKLNNVLGGCVYERDVENEKKEISVDVSGLVKGMYFVEVMCENKIYNVKFIKQ